MLNLKKLYQSSDEERKPLKGYQAVEKISPYSASQKSKVDELTLY